jgi:heptaprenylglyceryl phosphate synthase
MLLQYWKTNLEVISTGYMLIESGVTAVEAVSKTKPLSKDDWARCSYCASRRDARNKLIYLEAGSGAKILFL